MGAWPQPSPHARTTTAKSKVAWRTESRDVARLGTPAQAESHRALRLTDGKVEADIARLP